jgi:hypothetical protein
MLRHELIRRIVDTVTASPGITTIGICREVRVRECPIRCVGMTETEERHVYEDRPA